MKRIHAITREVSPSIGRCELTHVQRRLIDIEKARAEHAAYRDLLDELGCVGIHLPAAAEMPDSTFVEDTAFVVAELAIVARPGVGSRRSETDSIADVLVRFRELFRIEAPATVDGGDVLCLGNQVWVGLSSRTNEAGIEQITQLLAPRGYDVNTVRVEQCLHLKSAVTAIGPDTVLLNPDWISPRTFPGLQVIEIDPQEPFAANALLVGENVVVSTSHPRTRARLEQTGISCHDLDTSELAKAEGGLTCCSLLFEV